MLIAMKICHNKPIRFDEIYLHWRKLYMREEQSNEELILIAEDWSGLQERLKRVSYQMKLEIKEGLRLLAFPKTTMLSLPPRKVPTKGEKKKSMPRKLCIMPKSDIPNSFIIVFQNTIITI